MIPGSGCVLYEPACVGDKAGITTKTIRGMAMNLHKIAGILGLVVAVVGAFIAIPYAALILLLLGLVVGFGVTAEHNVRVIVSAIALSMFAGAFLAVPAVGTYLRDIVAAAGQLAAGAALYVILNNIYHRFLGK